MYVGGKARGTRIRRSLSHLEWERARVRGEREAPASRRGPEARTPG